MLQILKNGQIMTTNAGLSCKIDRLLGSGGQGEVYEVTIDGKKYALKWYYPEQATNEQRVNIECLITKGPPDARFLWPQGIVSKDNQIVFGYVMPLREKRFKGLVDLMNRKAEPTFKALCTAAYRLVDSYHQLHSSGFCYRDISFGNVFFDPHTGEILICDNDNVTIDNGNVQSGISGTPRFMAPEIVRGEATPSSDSDLFSLAVLLFYMLMIQHPLEGLKESHIRCFDIPAMNKLYGSEPLFIWNPDDTSNRPVPGLHNNAIEFWNIYPEFLKIKFTEAFTAGMQPNKRVRIPEWCKIFIQLQDSIVYCTCGSENFYDADKLKQSSKCQCWACHKELQMPPSIRIGTNIVMLNANTELYPHHVGKSYDIDTSIAIMTQHPQNPSLWGLKNITNEKWVVTKPDGSINEVEPQRSVSLGSGVKINFGIMEGEIRA